MVIERMEVSRMEKQDKLHVYKKLHRISLLIGVLTILLPIIFWGKIPDEIPMHYNAAGVVDNWSDKSSLILLFFVVLMLMGVMSIAVCVVKSNMESKPIDLMIYATFSSKETRTENLFPAAA